MHNAKFRNDPNTIHGNGLTAFSVPLHPKGHYRAVKTILQKGLDQQALLLAFDTLTATYTEGGRFCRDISTLLQ